MSSGGVYRPRNRTLATAISGMPMPEIRVGLLTTA
ncbi:hypothetical protein EYZ11_008083 [Aspergillus tanneri]|uniref:Uncharacterized protein n=1 Tax=Aspergillus tanneri TaxID=1220188 RepID=A0A4S3JGW9_9EURO|nr:hypothetical protein EYZ11_008083 [Aspergillus tanneri]